MNFERKRDVILERNRLQEQLTEQKKQNCKTEKINLSDIVEVKLTMHGAEVYYDKFNKLPTVDDKGYTKILLRELIEIYGDYILVGGKDFMQPLLIRA